MVQLSQLGCIIRRTEPDDSLPRLDKIVPRMVYLQATETDLSLLPLTLTILSIVPLK